MCCIDCISPFHEKERMSSILDLYVLYKLYISISQEGEDDLTSILDLYCCINCIAPFRKKERMAWPLLLTCTHCISPFRKTERRNSSHDLYVLYTLYISILEKKTAFQSIVVCEYARYRMPLIFGEKHASLPPQWQLSVIYYINKGTGMQILLYKEH